MPPGWQTGKGDIERGFFNEQIVYDLVDVIQVVLSLDIFVANLSQVAQQGLQILVNLGRFSSESQVNRAEDPHVFVIVVENKLEYDAERRKERKQ